MKALSRNNPLSLPNELELCYQHSLLPLYGPFITEKRRLKCLDLMYEKQTDCLTSTVGYMAYRIPKLTQLRTCPLCYKEQITAYSEPYFKRIHHVIGLNFCAKHGVYLIPVRHFKTIDIRNEYLPLSMFECPTELQIDQPIHSSLLWLSQRIEMLLNRQAKPSMSFEKWTNVYRQLGTDAQVIKSGNIDNSKQTKLLLDVWSHDWLKSMNLFPKSKGIFWLTYMMRETSNVT